MKEDVQQSLVIAAILTVMKFVIMIILVVIDVM